MKKLTKRFSAFVLALVMLCACSATAFATETVTYYSNPGKFVFTPVDNVFPTDLFSGMKNVMPGDSITEDIILRNAVNNRVSVKLFLRSRGSDAASKEFLSQLGLKVTQSGKTKLFDAAANKSAQLTEWVYLGTLHPGGEIPLSVTLDVPIEMGNEFQDAVGRFVWEFYVEELPVYNSFFGPRTGDDANVSFYACGAAFGLLGFVLLLVFILKNNSKERGRA